MANYFRITAYHPAENVCAIFDSNGRFEKLWQFSSYLIQRGFKIIEVGAEDKFDDGDFDRAPAEKDKIILRACAKGQPVINGSTVQVNGNRISNQKREFFSLFFHVRKTLDKFFHLDYCFNNSEFIFVHGFYDIILNIS